MKQLYAFQRDEARVLSRIARSHPLAAQSGAGVDGKPVLAGGVGAWIVETTTSITAATYSTNVTPGSGTVKIKKLGSTYLEDHETDGAAAVTRTLKNLWPFAVPSGFHLIATRTLDGTLWASEWLDRPQMLCRFQADAAFTTTDSSVAGTIDVSFGLGSSHDGDSGTFNNLSESGGNYLFEGDANDYGLAYHDGGSDWTILQMECP